MEQPPFVMNFYCFFCSQRCHKLAFESEWWQCVPCKVRYRGDNDLHEIEFPREINGRKYLLSLEITSNKTKVYELIDNGTAGGIDWGIDQELVINTKPVLNGVTADNAENKIRTLLTFS